MVNWKSNYANGIYPVPVAQGAEIVTVRASIALTTALASADILEFCQLPPDHVPVDCVIAPDDLDGGAGLAFSVGLLNSGKTDLSTATEDGVTPWIATSAAAQTGVIARPTTRFLWRVTPNATTARMFGAKITTGAATAVAGTITADLMYRAAHYGA